MSTLMFVLVGVFIAITVATKWQLWHTYETRSQIKAICKAFECKKNDFSYFLEDDAGYFIVSVFDHEYRIKFSVNRPCQVVYCQEVQRTPFYSE